jgi:hypothetical protein
MEKGGTGSAKTGGEKKVTEVTEVKPEKKTTETTEDDLTTSQKPNPTPVIPTTIQMS